MQGETFGEDGLDWLQSAKTDSDNTVENDVLLPRDWQDARFGGMRPSAPVVGVSWYEANAYCKWLLEFWDNLEEGGNLAKPRQLRLPYVGGVGAGGRWGGRRIVSPGGRWEIRKMRLSALPIQRKAALTAPHRCGCIRRVPASRMV